MMNIYTHMPFIAALAGKPVIAVFGNNSDRRVCVCHLKVKHNKWKPDRRKVKT